ncbi:unnamed protein product [Pseudo-nitzschia multistriata]|uniref:CobW C-terminal domain-containing protein n=1 Tax=Pseudo-nitzschia multistriata TaxID=183589 RepID=A0A448ZJS5_9STRA|nr:unnamed protein product [Pseudo-nitzschia multistriata]
MAHMENDETNYVDEDSDDEAPDLIAIAPDRVEKRPDGGGDGDAPASNSPDGSNDVETPPPCPVTILSGFLGSGKTTLIQYILKSPDHGRRIAVIENEFGEGLAIESLIARDGIDPGSGSLQDLIELPNGCVCCTVKDSLVETLENLIAKRSDLDYILIEASGMADPGPIASVFWLDDALESRLKLDGIVTLVDGRHILDQLEATEEAARQIAYADRILLNKVDLLEGNAPGESVTASSVRSRSVSEVEQILRKIHPTAPILRTSFSKVPNLDWILDADCFSGFDHLEEVEHGLAHASRSAGKTHGNSERGHGHDDHNHHHEHGDGHDCSECCEHDGTDHHTEHHHHHHHHHADHHEHTHTNSISTVAFEQPGTVDVARLNAWLADILWPNQDETDKVLTAMLHRQEEDGGKHDEGRGDPPMGNTWNGRHESGSKEGTQQQIFRIKGILSVEASDDYFWDESGAGDVCDSEAGGRGSSSSTTTTTLVLDPRRFIVQAVHDLWDIQPVTSADLHWNTGEERVGKIVVIGKSLREADLRAGFEACFLQDA